MTHTGVGKMCALEMKMHCTTFDFPNAQVKSKFVKQFEKFSAYFSTEGFAHQVCISEALLVPYFSINICKQKPCLLSK